MSLIPYILDYILWITHGNNEYIVNYLLNEIDAYIFRE